ncbi:penicillin-binding transpeptidase domain-containing protein [Vallitalea sp.]|uniref:penicillin-binding transpeptidase domain-containing protein n=1 Tax=Vallitalea sp. TaxID=1882829 RepID=UPI0025DE2692|nr:penicillin-binding transpeptidase domain-containing protein [Vallitalea sp.]MCT4688197.1 penicillin-binding transpeptidase domain-containing protein [Vallitalea sp.]
MLRTKTHNRKRTFFICSVYVLLLFMLCFRVGYIMICRADFLQEKAEELHNRERVIKAERGSILDRNGIPIAVNKSVTCVSVIHNQITNKEKVIEVLCDKLELEHDLVKKKVENKVALERIKMNVEKEVADEIREYDLDGIIIDEDYKRIYPFSTLGSHVIGFVGKDNQGIIGLEVKYDKYLKGEVGMILTRTNAKGIEIENLAESRKDSVAGYHLVTSMDVNIQKYAEQALEKVLISKNANRGSIIVMNPQNGEIYAMANKPDFDLNKPFDLGDLQIESSEEQQKILNQIWRNYCINDTYEPGSTFKVVTASAGLEEKVVKLDDTFFCPGYSIVADRRIRCHKAGGHGSETFVQGVQNSCNPVFMAVAERLGVDKFLKYFDKFGLLTKTGIDLPGEAVSIMHKKADIGPVELATMSFGQSFQITPLQLIRAGSAVVNGGKLITPHFGIEILNQDGEPIETLKYDNLKTAISKETSDTMANLLESVVSEGTGRRCYVPGYKVGGKTATSEKLPRSSNKYISSFLGFAPADNPQVIALVLVDEPEGIYYGGTVAAPVIRELYENILPYMGINPKYIQRDFDEFKVGEITIPNLLGKNIDEAKKIIKDIELEIVNIGNGETITEQFPLPNDKVNRDSKLILFAD